MMKTLQCIIPDLHIVTRMPLCMLITTKVVNSNPAYGGMYSIQHYMGKPDSNLRQIYGFSVYSANKTDRHDITEIVLKVALSTILGRV